MVPAPGSTVPGSRRASGKVVGMESKSSITLLLGFAGLALVTAVAVDRPGPRQPGTKPQTSPGARHQRQGTSAKHRRQGQWTGSRACVGAAAAERRLRAGAADGRRARHLRLRRAASRDPEATCRATAAAAARATRPTSRASSRAATRRATCSSGTRTASAAPSASTSRARRCSSTRRAPTSCRFAPPSRSKWTPGNAAGKTPTPFPPKK